MTAREHGPHHAVGRKIDAARAVALIGRQVDFCERGLRRVRARHQTDDVARLVHPRETDVHRLAPDRIVDRARLDAIERRHHPLVLGGVERLVGLDVLVAFAVAVGVEDDWGPTLRLHLVAGLFIHFGVEPADHAALGRPGAGPQRVVGVLAEIEVMRLEAGVDERPLAGLRVVHRELPAGLVERRDLGGRMVRALLAEVGVCRRPDPRGEPDPALLVHDRVVDRGVAVPDCFFAPVHRWSERQVARRRRLRVAIGMLDDGCLMMHRVEHRDVVGAFLRRSVDQAIGIERRRTLVGRDRVVQVMFVGRPIPHADDDVALDALRTFGLGKRQLAGRDAVGPVAVERKTFIRAEPCAHDRHVGHRLPGLQPACPGFLAVLEFAEVRRDRANAVGADGMT